MSGDAGRRVVVLTLALGAVVGAAVADHVVGRPSSPASVRGPATAVLGSARASSSAWYCAASAGAPAGTQASVVLMNPSARAVEGRLDTVAPTGTGSQGTGFAVPPGAQLVLPLPAGTAGRVVLDGGGVGAYEAVAGPLGWSATPCVSAAASQWYFAAGSTAPGVGTQLSLFNPTPSDAVVNVTFVSSTNGVMAPPAYQGLPVPAGSVVVENLSDHVQKVPLFATEVSTLSGTVVAAESTEAGGPGNGGLSLVNGVAAPAAQWGFAQNTDLTGGGNTFTVLNPSAHSTTVRVSIELAQGQATPVTLQVPGSSLASFAAHEQTRIPSNVPFALTFRSSGAGIVVARQTLTPAGTMPTIGTSAGTPGGQSRWLIPPLPFQGASALALGVLNLGRAPLHVTVAAPDASGRLVALPGERRAVLRGGGLLVLGPNPAPPVGRAPLEVVADGPIAVELDPAPSGGPGTVVLPVWPLLDAGG